MNRWVILAALFTARLSVAIAFQAVAAVMPFMVQDLAIGYAEAGLLMGLFMLPGIVLAIPTGWLAARFGDKAITLLGLAVMTVGSLIVAQSTSFAGAAIGRVLCGSGAIVLNVLVAKMTTDWFAGREIASAMAVLVSSWPIGLAMAMAGFGWWVTVAGWTAALQVTAAASALGLVLIAALYRPPPAAGAKPVAPRFRLGRHNIALAVLAGLVWGVFNAGAIIFLSFVPALLLEQGWSTAVANGIASLVAWLCIPLILLGGHLADRTARDHLIIAGSALLSAVLMAAAPLAALTLVAVVLVGVVWATPAGPIMALPQILPPAERASGFGVFFTVYYACMAALPAAAGLLLDIGGSQRAPILLAATLMAATAALLWLFRRAASGVAAPKNP
jgi:MFS family permease